MSRFLRWYRYVNILSIDTAVGAVVSSLFVARLIGASVWIYGKVALGLTVWVIYTADHLMDAWKVKARASSERHRFHQRHFNVLALALVIGAVIDLIVVLFMRNSLLYYGLILSVIVLLYLVISRYLKMLKEIFIAFIYTAGVMLPSLAAEDNWLNQWHLLLMFNFFLVAFANLLIFSWFDLQNDLTDGHVSFVTIYGRKKTKAIIHSLYIFMIVTSLLLIVFQRCPIIPVLIIFCMMTILVLILRFDEYFKVEDRFRYAGDAVFFLPGIYILIHPFDAWPY